MVEEREHATGGRVAGGLVAGDHEEEDEEVELVLAEGLAVLVRLEELGDDVVLGVRLALGGELVGVGVDLHGRARALLGAGGVVGVLGADHAVGPVEQLVAIGRRGSEQFADHVERQGCGDFGDEVDLAGQLVEEVVADIADVLFECSDRARGEAAVDQRAPPRVLGRVLVEHHEALERDLVLGEVVEEGELAVGGEEVGVS
ncbi:hypothetical protein ACFQQB_15525 [Nonomuraea rubra]|uniref:hypothetical protein n=1 Tax=Nonomuraea rubra TaxID=46180 RepID=UPI003617786E